MNIGRRKSWPINFRRMFGKSASNSAYFSKIIVNSKIPKKLRNIQIDGIGAKIYNKAMLQTEVLPGSMTTYGYMDSHHIIGGG
jgi:hypothetical protein